MRHCTAAAGRGAGMAAPAPTPSGRKLRQELPESRVMPPRAVPAHCLTDSRKHLPPHAQSRRQRLEPISRIAAPPAAAIAAAQAAFAELGLSLSLQEYGTEAARLVGQITDEPDIAVATWLAQARAAGFECSTATAIARFGTAAERLAGQLGRLGDIGLPANLRPSPRIHSRQAQTLRQMLPAIPP